MEMQIWFNENSGIFTALGFAAAVVVPLLIYFWQKNHKKANPKPNIIMRGNVSHGNGGDGIRVEGVEGVELQNNVTANNKGSGINIKD